ncbi:hypothetical protein C0J52_17641 [Blattella germanica]|nr:hypothetical protein C0J52_17641 [Blattella germanica]
MKASRETCPLFGAILPPTPPSTTLKKEQVSAGKVSLECSAVTNPKFSNAGEERTKILQEMKEASDCANNEDKGSPNSRIGR